MAPPATIVPPTSVNVILFPSTPLVTAVTVIVVSVAPAAAVIPAIPLVTSPDPAPYLTTDESRPLMAATILLRVVFVDDSPTCTSFAVPSDGSAGATTLIVMSAPAPPILEGTLTVKRSLLDWPPSVSNIPARVAAAAPGPTPTALPENAKSKPFKPLPEPETLRGTCLNVSPPT